MCEQTRVVLVATLSADPSVTPQQKETVLNYLEGKAMDVPECENRVIKREEAAQILGVTTKTIDWMARQEGSPLRRVYTNPSRSRACGYTRSSVMSYLRSQAQ